MTEHNFIVGNTYTTRGGDEKTFLGVFQTIAGDTVLNRVGEDHLLFVWMDEDEHLASSWHYPDGAWSRMGPTPYDIMPPKKMVYLNRWKSGNYFLYDSAEKAVRLADPNEVDYTHIAFPIELPPTYGVDTKGE